MKLSDYAKKLGISYRTAWEHYKKGLIKGYQLSTGTIIITEETNVKPEHVIIYARVSSSQNRSNLDSQADRLVSYCMARGYQVNRIVKEVGSGINDKRSKLKQILTDDKVTIIVVEHKDRLTRFGYNYLEILLSQKDVRIDIVNEAATDKEDLMQDLISIITSMVARYYGQRRSKRKTEQIIKTLKDDKENNPKP